MGQLLAFIWEKIWGKLGKHLSLFADPDSDPHKQDVMDTKFPYLEFPYPGISDIEKRKGRRFIKTHLPCHLLPESINQSKVKV